jgi:hypothetical protein
MTRPRDSRETCIARCGADKVTPPLETHPGMSEAQQMTHAKGGLGHATSSAKPPDASSANPLDPEPQAKALKPIPVHPFMKVNGQSVEDGNTVWKEGQHAKRIL